MLTTPEGVIVSLLVAYIKRPRSAIEALEAVAEAER
jgi:hypothetical protein